MGFEIHHYITQCYGYLQSNSMSGDDREMYMRMLMLGLKMIKCGMDETVTKKALRRDHDMKENSRTIAY